ncbi:hypothetical protein BC360_23155 [Ensifer sp. LC163]|nr:hypothetical protein BC360_23155 [Ensifer sp. LC163]
MKKRTVVLGGVAAATLLAGGWAYAQSTGYGPGRFGSMFAHGLGGMGPGMMREMMGGGQTFGDLAIKPEQEAAWTKYATTLKDAAGAMTAAFDGAANDPKPATPQDHFARMTKIRDWAGSNSGPCKRRRTNFSPRLTIYRR